MQSNASDDLRARPVRPTSSYFPRRGEPFSCSYTLFTFDYSFGLSMMLLMVYLAQRQSNRGNEMCDNEMSRDHDAPVEYCENSLR